MSFKRSRNKFSVKKINLNKTKYFLAFILSILIGMVTGTLGASGGIMFVAVMMLLSSIDIKKMIGTATPSHAAFSLKWSFSLYYCWEN